MAKRSQPPEFMCRVCKKEKALFDVSVDTEHYIIHVALCKTCLQLKDAGKLSLWVKDIEMTKGK